MSRLSIRLTALAFVLLYLASVFVPTIAEGSYSDATVLGLYADAATRWRAEIAGVALTLAAVAMIAFVAQALAATGTTRDSWLGRLAGATGTAYAVMLLLTATAFAAVSAGINTGELDAAGVSAETGRLLSMFGFYALLVPGSITAGVTIAALGRLGRSAGTLPAWCARLGYVVGLLCLVPFWPTQFLPALWVLCAGLSLRTGTESSGSVHRPVRREAARPVVG